MTEKYYNQSGHSSQTPTKTSISQLRAAIGEKAYGHVLEIGSGTGANFPYYKNALRVDAVEPDEKKISRSRHQVKKAKAPIQIHVAKAEKLPFNENVFDTVVATLVFCTIPEPQKALEEIQRVAKPGARIFFLEHVRMPQPIMGKAQDLMAPLWKKAFGGCHLNRDTLALIQNSKLSITVIETYYKGWVLKIDCLNDSLPPQ